MESSITSFRPTISNAGIQRTSNFRGTSRWNGIHGESAYIITSFYLYRTQNTFMLKTNRSPRKFYLLASAAKRHCLLSQIYEHMALTGHTCNFNEAKMIATSLRKGTRLLLESWFSDNKAANRRIDLRLTYQAQRQTYM